MSVRFYSAAPMAKNRTPRSKSKKPSVAPAAAQAVQITAPVATIETSAPAAVMKKVNVVDHTAIARRAYQLFLERGGLHGDPLADWLRAESELQIHAA